MPTPARNLVWRNWHETVSQPLRRFEVLSNPDETKSTIAGYQATARRIQSLILEAAEQDLRVRATGGGWSFTDVAATDGMALATQRLNYRFGLGARDVQGPYAAGHEPVLLQCGISIADVNRFLAGRNQAVPTSGASNGQTIAGALATGTHGAAIDIGAIPEYVAAIHLATSPAGRTIWLERRSHPVLTPAALKALDVDLLPDDALFDAALVSFGAFGVVLGVVIEPVPAYYLHAFREPVKLDGALWNAITTTDFTAVKLPGANNRRPRHLEVLCNVLDGETTIMTVMYHEPVRPPNSGSAGSDGGVGKGDSALDVIGAVTDTWDGASVLAAKMLTRGYKSYHDVAGLPGEVFKDTSTRGRGASSAMGLPVAQTREAFDIACQAVKRHTAPALVAMRFVKATQATLGFTCHAPVTCVLEVDGAYSQRTLAAQQDTWRGLEQAGIPYAFHWGKMNDLDDAKVRARYGQQRVDDWLRARRRLLPSPELRRIFSNAFTDKLGLSL